MDTREYQEMIHRVRQMEQLYDRLSRAMQHTPAQIARDPELLQMQEQLRGYYCEGPWLHDYAADEQGLLPRELKRGVLSQDGLFDLLQELADCGACEADIQEGS